MDWLVAMVAGGLTCLIGAIIWLERKADENRTRSETGTMISSATMVKSESMPRNVHINVQEGERVAARDPLMDGPRNPHDILDVRGEKELQK